MALQPGSKLGVYEVTAKIGAGGMGEVYRAHDTTLDRDVAIKVLPDAFATDPERLARFEREAKVLASLNHPNIAAIYGLEKSDDTRALILELVEGPTLQDRIAKGPIPLDEALPIARQIAEALEAAHEQGIIHRDLKPANVKVKDDGTVKVLDFGLAKALGPELSDTDAANSPTMTMTAAATKMGVIMGTAAYMSPEQAAGKPADRRSDNWSFGVVLWEMLTGQQLFTGESVSHVLSAVLGLEPEWDELPGKTPAAVRRVLRRCLQKDPRRRLHHIADARLEMEDGEDASEAAGQPATQAAQARSKLVPWVSAAVVAVAAVAALLIFSAEPAPAPEVTRFTLNLPEGTDFAGGSGVTVSPDGRTVVFSVSDPGHGGQRLYRRDMDSLDSAPIRGTDGARHPFFSADGASVGFFTTSAVMKVSLSGGIPVLLADMKGQESFVGPSAGAWLEDDSIVFSSVGPAGFKLSRVSASGVEPSPVVPATENGEEIAHHHPAAIPGGRGFVSIGQIRGSSRVYLHQPGSGEPVPLIPGRLARVSPSGHLVFERGGTLWAVGLDIEQARVTGEPVLVVDLVGSAPGTPPMFDLSANGSLVYVTAGSGVWKNRSLFWVSRDGREEPLDLEPRPYWFLHLSPDGGRIGFHIMDPVNMDAHIHDLRSGVTSPFTFDRAIDGYPLWAPDGERIVFWSSRDTGVANLFVRAADGTGSVERLTDSPNRHSPYSWTDDGLIVFTEESPETSSDIWKISIDGDRVPEPVLQEPYAESRSAVSPDGRWIAYQSNESGEWQIWVRPFPDVESGRWPVGTGGMSPKWSPDGRELYYRGDGAMMAVRIDTADEFSAGPAVRLFEDRYVISVSDVGPIPAEYAVAPDGRFLMMKDTSQSERATEVIVVLNWDQELLERVPVP